MTETIDAQAGNSQSFMQIGVKINTFQKPTDSFGQEMYPNLYACGHVCSGFDFSRDKSGFGVSLATALLALTSLS